MQTIAKTLTVLAILAFLPGCAQFYHKQTDRRYVSESGTPIAESISRTRTYTFFKSSQDVSGFKATQTEPGFSTSVEVAAQSSATEESAADLAGKVVEGVIEGLKTANGLP